MYKMVKIMPIGPQMNKLLDLLSADGVLVKGRVNYHDTTKQNFWQNVAAELNSVEGGALKSAWKWCKVWCDWKTRTHKKANIVLKRKSYPNAFEQQTLTLSDIEMRLLRITGYPLEGKADKMQLEMANTMEVPDNSMDEVPEEAVIEEYLIESEREEIFSEREEREERVGEEREEREEKPQVLEDANDEDFFNQRNHNKNNDNTFEVSDDSIDITTIPRKRIKVSDCRTKKKNMSVEGYKIKAQIELQRERQQQKREELRLRAIELKLRGDELRLKEMEMNKVNYLTNLEEEKLKCFREISTSLKEFLDRTRTGNIRLHNVI